MDKQEINSIIERKVEKHLKDLTTYAALNTQILRQILIEIQHTRRLTNDLKEDLKDGNTGRE